MSNLRLFMSQGALLIGMLLTSLPSLALPMPTTSTGPQQDRLATRIHVRMEGARAFYTLMANNPETYPWPIIPQTTILKNGDRDKTLVLIHQRLRMLGDLPSHSEDSKYFDDDLAQGVKHFQWRHGLNADGVIGERTLTAMNVTPTDRIHQLDINMQRWARLNKVLGNQFLLVNVPEFELHYFNNNREQLTMRVIVGKPTRPTPEIISKVTRMIFNPGWNVPQMIAQNDIVPKLITDEEYLDRNQIRLYTDATATHELNPQEVDWQSVQDNGFRYHFKQDPGENNALGLVKFEFPNSHDIFLHDTPAKSLFTQDARAFSSGCVRLEKPFSLVDFLTKNDTGINQDMVSEKLAEKNTAIYKLDHAIPLVITYLTAWVDNNNVVHFMDDIYGQDGLQGSVDAKGQEELAHADEESGPGEQTFMN